MYNASLHIKFFWVDDYYITGILTKSVNATFHKLDTLYIVEQNLVHKSFTNKKSDYTSFGHIPDKINMMYKLWKILLGHQIRKYPLFFKSSSNFLTNEDFVFLRNFKWSADLWLPYLNSNDIENDEN
jgi:hypothetical protein